jgi:carboxyl-terminal processing protease
MKSKEKYLPILLFSCVALGVMIGGMLNFPKGILIQKIRIKPKLIN